MSWIFCFSSSTLLLVFALMQAIFSFFTALFLREEEQVDDVGLVDVVAVEGLVSPNSEMVVGRGAASSSPRIASGVGRCGIEEVGDGGDVGLDAVMHGTLALRIASGVRRCGIKGVGLGVFRNEAGVWR